MKTREVIERVHSLYSKGVSSDDSRLSSRLVYNKLITVRSRLLVQKAKAHQKISQWNYQTLECIPLQEALKHECPLGIPDKCVILRSVEPLPKILTDMDNLMIQSVTTIDGSLEFTETFWENLTNKNGNRFTKYSPEYYIRNGYLYITLLKSLELVQLTAIFGDPVEAEGYGTCGENTDCINLLDKEFPIDHDLIDMAVKMASDELILLFSQMTEDKVNNASDDSSPVKMPRGSQNFIGD